VKRLRGRLQKRANQFTKSIRAFKTGKMEEVVTLERQFKPITESLKQLVENTVKFNASKIELLSLTLKEA